MSIEPYTQQTVALLTPAAEHEVKLLLLILSVPPELWPHTRMAPPSPAVAMFAVNVQPRTCVHTACTTPAALFFHGLCVAPRADHSSGAVSARVGSSTRLAPDMT